MWMRYLVFSGVLEHVWPKNVGRLDSGCESMGDDGRMRQS